MSGFGDRGAKALAGAALLALLSSCFNTGVPPGAQLTCSADSDCPPGLVCRKVVNRCLDPKRLDSTPPGLEEAPVVSPAVAREGQPVTIAFRTTELLLGDPAVLVGDKPAKVDEEGTARSERRYRFVLVPDGTEPQNAPATVSLTLVDQTGNEALVPSAGTVTFDFAAPALAGPVEVVLEGPPKSLVDPVQKVGVGARVSVAIAFDEATGVEPVVEAVWADADPKSPKPDEVLTFVRRSGGPLSYVFEHSLVASATRPQGPYVLRTDVRDAAGNRAPLTLSAGFEVDTQAPASPDVATEGRVVFRREPWGTEAGAGVRRMHVVALPGGVEAGAALFVFNEVHGEVGHATADGKGAATVDLPFSDLARVLVRAVDAAGNASAEVPVRDLEWVATLGGKVAGSTRENPHQFVSRSRMGSNVIGPLGPLYGARPQSGAALARVDAAGSAGLVRQTGEPTWAQRDPRPRPVFGCTLGTYAMGGAIWARDAARDQIVALSGDGLTWVFNGDDWRPIITVDPEGDGDPTPRCGSALIYDERRGEVVLVGGLGVTGETWAWTGSSWRLANSGEGPTARSHAAAGYDKLREEVVLFGGTPALSGIRQDTWVWDGTRWHERTPQHKPPGRYGAVMAWDPVGQTLVMFGGESFGDDELQDLWRWDGSDWVQVVPASSSAPWPKGRSLATMVTDPVRKRVVLMGGATDKHENNLDVWEWDGAAWSSRSATPNPFDMSAVPGYAEKFVYPGRGASPAYYDPVRERIVLFGGVLEYPYPGAGKGYLYLADLWDWDPGAGTWTDRTAPLDANTNLPPTPRVRFGGAMVYDEQRGKALLFGGASSVKQETVFGDTLDDLWSWDGKAWEEVKHSGTWPKHRAAHGMAYDPVRGATVMYGGWDSEADTWERTDTWRLGSTAVPGKPWVASAVATFEGPGPTATVTRFGGVGITFSGAMDIQIVRSAETATWNGTAWDPLSPANKPMPRELVAMGPDGRSGLILFGGEVANALPPNEELPFKGVRRNDTWRWDGSNWTSLIGHDPLRPPTEGPEPRMGHTMVFDRDRGRLVLADGYGTGPLADLWDWDPDATAWVRRVPSNPDSGKTPLPAMGRAAAYDSRRKKMLFFGGLTSTRTVDDFWELDAGLGQRPGHVFSVVMSEAGFPAEAVLTRVQATAVAGGTGPDADGVELWGWWPEGWQVLGTEETAKPGALGTVAAQVDDAARLARVTFQDGLHFAVVPKGTNGATPAEVVTDYIEVVVRSRLPAP
ncbi:MAG: hypothetical protein QM765_41985 [Myxococcales bacterium]